MALGRVAGAAECARPPGRGTESLRLAAQSASVAARDAAGAERRPDVLADPLHQRPARLELRAHALVAPALVQPGPELVAARHRQRLQAQQVDARMVHRVTARRALEPRLGQRQPGAGRLAHPPSEAARAPAVVEGAAKAVELVGRRLVQAGGDEQTVERQLEVVPAGAAVADRHPELLLDRRARVEARVVVGPEVVRGAEVIERLGERPRRRDEVLVVARAVGAEPLAVVVVLQLAEEVEGVGGPHAGAVVSLSVIRLALRVRRDDAEIALAELLELAPAGVEEVDVSADVVEYAVYGAPGELPALPDLRAAAGAALVDVTTTEVADDWASRWRAFHEPVLIDHRLLVRAPWHAPSELPEVVIDPGQAFGTGAHATTRTCLELLLARDPRGELVDVGCGSGVLAIAAARLGFAPVLGLDHEVASISATRANARANGVEVEARRWDLRTDRVPDARTMVANLVRPLLLTLAERMTAPPGALVVGGLLAHEAGEVAAAFAQRQGLRERDRRKADGWVALLLHA
jgi:ribosomal protein L11 methyltransferase